MIQPISKSNLILSLWQVKHLSSFNLHFWVRLSLFSLAFSGLFCFVLYLIYYPTDAFVYFLLILSNSLYYIHIFLFSVAATFPPDKFVIFFLSFIEIKLTINLIPEHFHTLKSNFMFIVGYSPFAASTLSNHKSTSYAYIVSFFEYSYKWNYTICGILCLAVHSHRVSALFLFYCSVVFHNSCSSIHR